MKKSTLIIVLAAATIACNNNEKQNNTQENTAIEQKTETASSSPDLFGKDWKLLELNGKAIVLDTTFPRQPHIIFETKNRVSGNLGCNGFGANLELKQNNEIKVSEIVATEMACPNLEIEQSFLVVLQNATHFLLENNTLTLTNDKKETTARLQAQ